MKNTKLIITSVSVCIVALIIILGFIYFVSNNREDIAPKENTVQNFDECIAAGNPVMESYPRQCRANGKTFVEDISKKSSMTEAEARVIAEKECIKGGEALAAGIYNDNSKTWWFDANLNATREGCNPACVVSVETKNAEINWRCTGLIPPK